MLRQFKPTCFTRAGVACATSNLGTMKSPLTIATLTIAALLSIPKSNATAPTLENGAWVLLDLNGKEFPAPPNDSPKSGEPTLKFDPEKKLASGRAAPNLYICRYELKDNTLKIEEGETTLIRQHPGEWDYLDMLSSVTGWRITEGKLELLKGVKIVARFSE